MIEAKEFYRTQREAGIHWAPWAENIQIARALGALIGIFMVAGGAMVIALLCAGVLRAMVGAS
jgi:hypothetical protein